LVQLALERRSEGFAVRRDLHVETMLEGGRKDGGATYLRLSGAGHVLFSAGATRLLLRAQGGVASAELPTHRAFVLGGRGTLLGDEFRLGGGRRMAFCLSSGAFPSRSCPSASGRTRARLGPSPSRLTWRSAGPPLR